MLRVLIADNDKTTAAHLQKMLVQVKSYALEAITVSTYKQAEKLIAENHFDVFLFSYFLGNRPSLELLLYAKTLRTSAAAILLVDEHQSTNNAAVHAGFSDVIEKKEITPFILEKVIGYALSVHSMKSQLRSFQNQNLTTLEYVNVCVITLDCDFRILYMNKKAMELLLIKKEDPYQFDNLFRYAKFIRDVAQNDLHDRFSESMEKKNTLQLSEGIKLINTKNKKYEVEITLSPFDHEKGKGSGAVLIINDISNTNELSKKLSFHANHDELTGLYNRNFFLEKLKKSLNSNSKYRQKFFLLFIDIDEFKRINDTLGHNYGDLLLQQVSERIKNCIQKNDTLARLGGDEFTIILHEIEKPLQAGRIADSIIHELSKPFNLMGIETSVGASIGIAAFPSDGKDKETLLKNADSAMYHAKEVGKNNYQFYNPSLNEKSLERLRLSNDMRRAAELNEFELHYQPQYNIKKNIMMGVEALIRWYHPIIGYVPPNEFIPLAEENGRIKIIGSWVLEQTCKQIKTWKEHNIDIPPVAVNLSVKQIETKFVDDLLVILNQFDIQPREIELEITENIFAGETKKILDILFELKFQGFNIAIDDFGTGYSSLSYLGKMPIDTIKIDQSFIRGLDEKANQTIVKTILAMGKELNKRVIAEGVELEKQRDFLFENGCIHMQGFLFAKPMLPSKLTTLLKHKPILNNEDLLANG